MAGCKIQAMQLIGRIHFTDKGRFRRCLMAEFKFKQCKSWVRFIVDFKSLLRGWFHDCFNGPYLRSSSDLAHTACTKAPMVVCVSFAIALVLRLRSYKPC